MTSPPRGGGRISGGGISRRLSERARQQPENSAAPADMGDPGAPVDLGARLRGVFDQLAHAVNALAGQDGGAITREGEHAFTLGGDNGRAVFGYTVRMGLDGLKAERFGDAPPTANARGKPAPRAPIADLFEEVDGLRVVAELPGVAEAEIAISLAARLLTIATTGKIHYEKHIELPYACDPASIQRSCSNGIVEIMLRPAAAP